MTRLLDVRDLAVSFRTGGRTVRAVNHVSFSLDEAETLAIVGESGSGKSVTALALIRLLGDAASIDSGSIVFEGADLLALPEPDMRRLRGNRIGMIFQEPMSSLNPVMTIGRQIIEPLELHRGLRGEAAREEAARLLSAVSIPDPARRLGSYPHEFSGGMRQRVMIAIAMACSPRLIIADEPTTALDVTVQAQVLELLHRLTKETGAALILITHDLGLVARHADRVAVMYAGRIVETGPTRSLFRTPRHPYTRGLLASIPRADAAPRTRVTGISGHPPDPAAPPPGCPFHPRCPEARPECSAAVPPLREREPGSAAACVL